MQLARYLNAVYLVAMNRVQNSLFHHCFDCSRELIDLYNFNGLTPIYEYEYDMLLDSFMKVCNYHIVRRIRIIVGNLQLAEYQLVV